MRSVTLLNFLFAIVALTGGNARADADSGHPLRDLIRERIDARRASREVSGPLGAGDYTFHLDHDGLTRKYVLHVPANFDGRRPLPLVVALHGGGGHAELMADDTYYGLGATADREGFAVVFPNGYSKLPGGRFATWNAGACCGDARDRQIDDVGFIRAVVAAVRAQMPIDPNRIFATGMSNGGMMSHRLACDAAYLFRAVASVAGPDVTLRCDPARAVSVLHIHARDDDHVLFNGGAGPEAFRDPSKVTDFTSVPDTIARWLRRDQCGSQPTLTLDRPGARCERYAGCRAGTMVELCVTADGGHSWPGGTAVRPGKEAPSKALDANQVIWDFFKTASGE